MGGVIIMFLRFAAATVLAASVSVWSSVVSAAEPAGAPETLIVTATRTATPLDTVLAPSAVIGRDELARSLAIDVTELLRFRAGLDVARTGGPGQPVSVFIRGAESNHTLVLVDGVRMNPGTIGAAALQNIAPALVERIEIVKGPRSTLYGSDAIGGVINVITRRPEPGSRLEVQAGAGEYETRDASLVTSHATDRYELGAGVAFIDSEGFPTRSLDTTDRGFRNLSVNAQGRARWGALDIAARHWQAEGASEYSDFFLTPLDQDFRSAMSAVTLEYGTAADWRSRVTLSRMEDRIEQNDSDDDLRTERYAADWQNDITIGGHAFTAGILAQREDASAQSFGAGFDARTRMTNLYLQDQVHFGVHALLLAAGYTDHETFGGHLTWNADYGIDIGQRTRLTASAGTAFRAPDATDRYGFGGNPELEPEESSSIEVGITHELTERHTVTLSAFENEIDDLIEFVVLDPDTFEGELRNVDRARIRGIEAGYQYRGDAWQLRAELSVQEPENLTTGTQLLRRTRESATVGAVRSFGPFELGLDVLYAGPREDFGFPEPTRLDSYVLANLTARAQLSRSLSLLARVENLFDEDYELASTYNTPDRALFFAVRYEQQR